MQKSEIQIYPTLSINQEEKENNVIDKKSTIKKTKKQLPSYVISLISLFGIFLIWLIVTEAEWIKPLFLPSPTAVFKQFWQLITVGYMDSTLWIHLSTSLARIFFALLFALITALPLGIAMGCNRIIKSIFDPIIELYRPIPPLAYLPLIIIWFGIGEFSKIFLIYLAIFAPLVIATTNGVKSTDQSKIRAALTLGATKIQIIRYIVLPSALPDIIIGIRIGLGVGWSTLVAAELIAATEGLGFMIQSAAQFLVTDIVILGIIIIAIIAFSLEIGLRYLQRKLVPWYGKH